ncbi:MAG: L-seryl-tRNA(Sec) selenium transferase [Spirochaetes bacterium]|nr:MAG: L-seryl-tRNA(Sec) selenium transferase [Spirochaetota bacterium]
MESLKLKGIPQIEKLLQDKKIAHWFPLISRALTTNIVRETIETIRKECLSGTVVPSYSSITERIDKECRKKWRRRIMRVVNATGIILHTNMGRSPIAEETWRSAEAVNCGYSNLEFDLETGKRGGRSGLLPDLFSALVGAESALIVNNNAAAVFLILSVFATGREVIVSRGEQIQIGGGFRIPDILRLSGARLVEVGTTNITTVEDYLGAITENTAMVLKVHRSNFSVHGFTREPSTAELAGALPENVLLAVDQGSGTTGESLPGETGVAEYIRQGAHLVCFSADKVLGGPQAGCIVGKREYIDTLSKHPLMRTFRPGKTIYSLLEDFLIRRLNGEQSKAGESFGRTLWEMRKIGNRIIRSLGRRFLSITPSTMMTGGGSSPDTIARSLSIELRLPDKPENVSRKLRDLPIPIIGTIDSDCVYLNLATIDSKDVRYIISSLVTLIAEYAQCT